MSTILSNLGVHVFSPGRDITGETTALVVERTFLAISGPRTGGGNLAVATAGTGARAFGVAKWSTVTVGDLVGVARGGVVRVTTGAVALAAGVEVQSDANGKAVAKSTGIALGFTVDASAAGADALVALY
jgi:Uncharacterized conserved protein (DUF2190)